MHGKTPEVLPQQAEGGGGYGGSIGYPPEQDITAAGNDSAGVIDIEPCDEDISSEILNADKGGICDGDRWAGLRRWFSRILLSPNIISTTIGVTIAMIAPLQKMLFDSPRAILRPLGAALEVRQWPETGARRKWFENMVSNCGIRGDKA